ncbi:hypothetical protein MRX96_054047, partial [Rhipicephalus microplus]
RLLERVGLSSPEEQDHETSPLTESTMRRLVVYPLPKNMGPGESEGRRAARARALLLQHQNDEGAVYVDVAKVRTRTPTWRRRSPQRRARSSRHAACVRGARARPRRWR